MARDRESILEIIRKCLSLSRSSSEHEAALAAAKAQELLFKYNLTMAEVQTDEKKRKSDRIIRTEQDLTARKNDGKWQIHLASALARYNFCDLLYWSNRVLFIGEQNNTEVCQELFHWLTIQLHQMATKAVREYTGWERKPVFRRGFYEGAVQIIRARLYEQWETLRQQSVKSTALVVSNSEAIQEYIQVNFPKVREARVHQGTSSIDGLMAGREAGKQVDISIRRKLETTTVPRLS